jgi:hypothetical protein
VASDKHPRSRSDEALRNIAGVNPNHARGELPSHLCEVAVAYRGISELSSGTLSRANMDRVALGAAQRKVGDCVGDLLRGIVPPKWNLEFVVMAIWFGYYCARTGTCDTRRIYNDCLGLLWSVRMVHRTTFIPYSDSSVGLLCRLALFEPSEQLARK